MNLQRHLHQLLASLFQILLISGSCLYNQYLRVQFADYRSAICWIQVLTGWGFSLTFLSNLPYCWRNRQGTGIGSNQQGLLLALWAGTLTAVCPAWCWRQCLASAGAGRCDC